MAETVARRGGLAVLPQDIPVDVVAEVIAWIKSRDLVYDTPLTLGQEATTGHALSLLPKRAHGGIVVIADGLPVGVVTEADCTGVDRFTQLRQVMSKDLLTLPAGVDPERAFGLLQAGRHKLAPVVGPDGRCVGILTRTGALRSTIYTPAADALGRLRVGHRTGHQRRRRDPRQAATRRRFRSACRGHRARPPGQDDLGPAGRTVGLARRAGRGRQRGHGGGHR